MSFHPGTNPFRDWLRIQDSFASPRRDFSTIGRGNPRFRAESGPTPPFGAPSSESVNPRQLAHELRQATEMRFINRHMVLARVFAVLFFLANSGFTVILYQCNMSGRTTTSPCCAMPDLRETGATRSATPFAGTLVRPAGSACTTLHLAGGLQLHPSTLENARAAKVLKADVPVACESSAIAFPLHSSTLHSSLLPESDVVRFF